MHSDQGNLSFSCLPSNLSCFTVSLRDGICRLRMTEVVFLQRVVDYYYVLLSNICSMLSRSMNDSFYSSFFFFSFLIFF